MPAPTRKAPTTPRSETASAGVGGPQRVRPGVGAAELQRQREQQGGRQVRQIDAGEVLGEAVDRAPDAVDLAAEVDRAEGHRARLGRLQAASSRSTILAPTLLAAALAAVYLAWAPASQDLAAATFRADLFADHGFAIWNNAWYAGHYLLSYSVLYPPLGALARPAAGRGARRRRGGGAVRAARPPAVRRGGARAVAVVRRRDRDLAAHRPGPVPARGSRSASARCSPPTRDRRCAAALLAALASLASPVAGLFVGARRRRDRARRGARAAGCALVARRRSLPIAALNLAFPTGGVEPFVFSAFVAIPLLAVARALAGPAEYRGAADRGACSTRCWRWRCS